MTKKEMVIMKELSIEQKAKRYDEVSKEVKDFFEGRRKMYSDVTQTLEYLFPEFIETDDEKIRKIISDILLIDSDEIREILDANNVLMQDINAWLEKQGEHEYPLKSSNNEDVYRLTERITKLAKDYELNLPNRSYDIYAFAKDILAWLERQNKNVQGKSAFEAIKEETVDNANKVEPKFKIGDKIIEKDFDECDCGTIIDIKDGKYIFGDGSFIWIKEQGLWELVEKTEPKFKVGEWIIQENIGVYEVAEICESWYEVIDAENKHYSIGFDKEYMCRLWTIEDAKEGDVLYHETKGGVKYIVMNKGLNEHGNINSYFRYNSLDGFGVDIPAVLSTRLDDITPATKEQRDILFKKMKDAGYEWDAEHKKLTAI